MNGQALELLLGQVNTFPGVVGSLLCGEQGEVVADALPATVPDGTAVRAAQVLADHEGGLSAIGGPYTMLSLRLGSARLLVRRLKGGHLVVLCGPAANTQPITLMAASTAPRLERLLAPPPAPGFAPALTPPPMPIARAAAAPPPVPAAPAPAPPPGQLWQAVQRIEAVITRKKLDPFRTRGAISMKAGVGLRAIDERTPDDAEMLGKLLTAAEAVLGEKP